MAHNEFVSMNWMARANDKTIHTTHMCCHSSHNSTYETRSLWDLRTYKANNTVFGQAMNVFDLLFLTNRDIIASVQAHIHWQKCALAFLRMGWDEMGLNWDEMTVEWRRGRTDSRMSRISFHGQLYGLSLHSTMECGGIDDRVGGRHEHSQPRDLACTLMRRI